VLTELEAKLPGPGGVFWKSGVHNVSVGGKPARLFVPQYKIMPLYEKFRKQLDVDGIPLGVDHLPTDLMDDNQILAKMNLLHVGDVKGIGTDGDNIFITQSALDNPAVEDLFAKGALPAHSVVGKIHTNPCPDSRADYVLEDMVLERVDYVEKGGCRECTVGDVPSELSLTGKFMEVSNMTDKKDENKDKIDSPVDPGVDKVDPVENVEQVDPEPEEDDDPLMKRIDALETSVSGLLDVVKGLGKPRKIKVEAKEPEDETEKLQKQVDELTLEAKSSRVKSTIKAAIKEGKAIPAMEESLVALGLADEDKFNDMMAKMPQMVDFTEHSKKDKSLEAKAPKMSKEEQKEYKEYRELKAKKRNTGIIASDKKE
jgi:hypothetical protein